MKKNIIILIITSLLLVLLDQLTKFIIVKTMSIGETIPLIDGVLHITSHRNFGAAWGILEGQIEFFVLITIASLGVFGYFAKDVDFKNKFLYSASISMLIGGTIGNFIDRIGGEGVVDFIDFRIINFPIFNVADICLTCGCALLAFYLLFLESKEEKKDV
jgi:signal peptidase II